MERNQKQRVDDLVNIYINHRMSTGHDAGWHGESTLGRLVDFCGDIPPPSGNDQADLKMLNEILFVRSPHHDLPQAERVLFSIEKIYRDAIIAKVFCRNRWHDNGKMMTRCNDAYIAQALNIGSVSVYRKRVQRAREQIIEMDRKTTRRCA